MEKQNYIDALKRLNTGEKSVSQLYNEISMLAMSYIRADEKPKRCAQYLSIEFLIGRVFYNNLLELGVLKETAGILKEKGIDITVFEEIEDAALGNGGLGRLAACYMDSGAAVGIPLYGYGIRYRYGLFRQKFENGYQKELPDDWQRFGDPWSIRKEQEKQTIRFADMEVEAVPYDMPIIGKRVNVLRLYQAEGNENAEKISGVLYPPDDTEEGKLLRIRQEYFLSAAAVGDIIREYEKRHGNDYRQFASENSIQLNDTHPVFAIPELIRVLQEKGLTYRAALKTAKQVFNYTNHTILPEALEHWDVRLLKKILPEITEILLSINTSARYRHRKEGYTSQESAATSIYVHSRRAISMANTAVFVANKINGVAEIHSEIIKRDLFAAEYSHHPEKFTNVTNGVTQRRWLQLANPELSSLLDRKIGQDWRERFEELGNLNEHADTETLSDFIQVKEEKKAQLFRYVEQTEGVKIGGNRILFAQVKRLHEYKRQLMTAFALLRLYYDLKNGKIKDFTPSVFLFGAKSAPSYFRAKGIIKYINEIIKLINADPETNSLLMGVFVTEYNICDAIRKNGTPINSSTVSKYIKALIDAKILYECPRFDMKSKRSISGEKKYYLADLSFYYAENTDNKINYGPVLENIVYIYAKSLDYSVSVGRFGKFECDFIVRGTDMQYAYIQVAYTIALSKETEDREYRPLESIKDNYPRYVVTTDYLLQRRSGIRNVNLIDFICKNEKF